MRLKPAGLRRRPKTKLVPISRFESVDDAKDDPHFLKLYQRFLCGSLSIALTRASVDRIRSTSLRWAGKRRIEVPCDVDPKHIPSLALDIRTGHRPTLFVYEDYLDSTGRYYFCVDDVHYLEAYRAVGIRLVPVAVLANHPRALEESALSVGHCAPNRPEVGALLKTVVPFVHENVPCLLGSNVPRDVEGCFRLISRAARNTAPRIREFHIQKRNAVHYHHTLLSVAKRVQDTVDAIRILFRRGLSVESTALVRILYELYLNFYLDWLAPEFAGPVLQRAALGTPQEQEKAIKVVRQRNIKRGISEADSDALAEAQRRMYRLCTNIAEKARLSPLGETFHRTAYPVLSGVAHQDFNSAAAHAGLLENQSAPTAHLVVPDRLLRWVDLISSAILVRIWDDVGYRPISTSPEVGAL